MANLSFALLTRSPLHKPSRTLLPLCWITAQFAVCAVCLVLASRSYPHYSIVDHDISFLGHPRLNPEGWQYWSLGMGLSGLMLWPVTIFLSRGMHALTAGQAVSRRRLVAAGTVAARSACVGLLGLALIPQLPGFGPGHDIAGVFAMGGLYVAMWCFAWILICSPPISLVKILLLGVAVAWGPVGFLLTQGWRYFAYGELGHDVNVSPQSPFLQFSLWEWLLFLCISAALFVVARSMGTVVGKARNANDKMLPSDRSTF